MRPRPALAHRVSSRNTPPTAWTQGHACRPTLRGDRAHNILWALQNSSNSNERTLCTFPDRVARIDQFANPGIASLHTGKAVIRPRTEAGELSAMAAVCRHGSLDARICLNLGRKRRREMNTSVCGSTSGNAIKQQPLVAAEGCQDPVLLNDWHAVAFDRDIKEGVLYPVRLLGRDLVIWRADSGDLHVWEDLCVHRGARLSKGWICNNEVVCPYHGWRYEGSGACTLIPSAPDDKPLAKARAFAHPHTERYGIIWTTLGEPTADIARFDEWHDAGYATALSGPYRFKANGFRSLENFLDISHFPFVHGALLGTTSKPDKLNHYTVEETERGLRSSEIRVIQPGGDLRGVPVMANYTYSVYRPLVGHFLKRIQDIAADGTVVEGHDSHFATYCAVQVVDETNCSLWLVSALDVKPPPSEKAVADRYDVILGQDREIIETQRPERIPVDLRYELHHRSDLIGQRYRSWLRSLNITYGTI